MGDVAEAFSKEAGLQYALKKKERAPISK